MEFSGNGSKRKPPPPRNQAIRLEIGYLDTFRLLPIAAEGSSVTPHSRDITNNTLWLFNALCSLFPISPVWSTSLKDWINTVSNCSLREARPKHFARLASRSSMFPSSPVLLNSSRDALRHYTPKCTVASCISVMMRSTSSRRKSMTSRRSIWWLLICIPLKKL